MAYGFKDNKCKTPVYAQDDFTFIHEDLPEGNYYRMVMFPDGYTSDNCEIVSINIYQWDSQTGYVNVLIPITPEKIRVGLNFIDIILPTDVYMNEYTIILRKKVN